MGVSEADVGRHMAAWASRNPSLCTVPVVDWMAARGACDAPTPAEQQQALEMFGLARAVRRLSHRMGLTFVEAAEARAGDAALVAMGDGTLACGLVAAPRRIILCAGRMLMIDAFPVRLAARVGGLDGDQR